MEFRELRYFQEIAKWNSITKAAESLHVSQPALSKMIKGLEEELEMTLLIRSNKTFELTDAGKAVLDHAKKITAQMAELNQSLQDLSNLMAGSIDIGLPPFIGSLFFPQVIAGFHKQYPNIKFHITEYGAARVVKSVQEGELEFGVAVLPVDPAEFNIYPLIEEELKLLVHHQHPFARMESVNFSDLANEELIFYHESFALHDLLWNRFIEAGFEPRILFKSTQWDLMKKWLQPILG